MTPQQREDFRRELEYHDKEWKRLNVRLQDSGEWFAEILAWVLVAVILGGSLLGVVEFLRHFK